MRRFQSNKVNCFYDLFKDPFTMVKSIVRIAVVLVFVLAPRQVQAQEVNNELEYRSGIDLSYKLNKKLKVSFVPEIRFDDSFDFDKYLFEGGLTYKPLKFLSLEGTYRYTVNPRTGKDTEYSNRFGLSAKAEKELGRFDAGFKIRYTNDADDGASDDEFFRYKLSLGYNIPKSKLTPEIAMEAFQQLGNDGGLYKMRFSAGADYKLFKNNYLGLSYKLDYYHTEYLNKHIVSLGYKIKF
ncbi:DUF2490 domain-containing protein [Geofilum sp. OHC36d9]|uniref:DUF2490 domain-containing protein n=1 Tax=Geofilum sp. OHC36d9 TaxID=3458413 RepID=UPI0040348221